MIEAAKSADQGFSLLLQRVRAHVENPDVDLGWRPDESWNLYGAIVKHVCFSTRSYLGPRMSGLEVPTVKPGETWTAEGIDRASLLELIENTAAFARRALESMTEESWAEETELMNRKVERGQVAMFGLVHAAQHLGQLDLMDRVRRTQEAARA